jgi:DNA repair and recombination protein RAD52
MSFAPSMHGSFLGGQSFADASSASHTFYEVSEATAAKIAALQAKLDQKLGPEYISQRPGPGGGPKLTYAEGWKIINLANEVFGFNGWSSAIVNLTVDFIDFAEDSRRYTVGVTAVIRVTLRDGAFHEDVGYGMLENSKSKGQALDKVCLLAYPPREHAQFTDHDLGWVVQEGGSDRRRQACASQLRECDGKLSVRQELHT